MATTPPVSGQQPPTGEENDELSEGSHIHQVEHVGAALDKSAIVGPLAFLLLLGAVLYTFTEYYRSSQNALSEKEVPKLTHVVDEVQGWRRMNYVAAAVMLLMFAVIVVGMMWYRRVRAERARQLDSVYWGLCLSSLASVPIFVLYRRRRRRQDEVRRQMKALAKNPPKTRLFVIWGAILLLVSGLVWYRRRAHARHLARKKDRMKIQTRPGHQTVVPDEKRDVADLRPRT